MTKIAVFGTGYVGCVTAACLSRDGHQAIGVDIDPQKVSAINAGQSPVSELGLEKLIRQQVAHGNLSATQDLEHAVRHSEIAMITVGTPSRDDGSVNSDAVERVVKSIIEVLGDSNRPYTIVVRSTLLPGILEERLLPLLSDSAGGKMGDCIRICNNPEFLREGSAIADYDDPPYVLVGVTDDWDAKCVFDLYCGIKKDHIVTDTRTAALVKYASNAMHAMKVTFANEMGSLAKAMDADGQKVMQLVCRDTKLNISSAYLRPGCAFGGSCLPKDLRALVRYAEDRTLTLKLLDSIGPANEAHLRRALEMIQASEQQKIGMVGLSFKSGTDDLRESPQVILAELLLARGFDIRIYDPNITSSQLTGSNRDSVDQRLPNLDTLLVNDPAELYEHASLLVLCTSVADQLDWQTQYDGAVFDLRVDLSKTIK